MKTLWKLRRKHMITILVFLIAAMLFGSLWIASLRNVPGASQLLLTALIAAPIIGVIAVLLGGLVGGASSKGTTLGDEDYEPSYNNEGTNPSTGLSSRHGFDGSGYAATQSPFDRD